MHRTTSSALAFAGTVAAAAQAAVLISWQGTPDDPASAVDALASGSAVEALFDNARFPGAARVAQPDLQHGWVAIGRVAAGEPPCPTP